MSQNTVMQMDGCVAHRLNTKHCDFCICLALPQLREREGGKLFSLPFYLSCQCHSDSWLWSEKYFLYNIQKVLKQYEEYSSNEKHNWVHQFLFCYRQPVPTQCRNRFWIATFGLTSIFDLLLDLQMDTMLFVEVIQHLLVKINKSQRSRTKMKEWNVLTPASARRKR